TLQPLFLQNLMGYTALASGIAVSPRGAGAVIMMPIVGRLVGKIDSRILIGIGFCVFALASFMLGSLNLDISMRNFALPTFISGFASAMMFVPLSAVAFGDLRKELMSQGTGIF